MPDALTSDAPVLDALSDLLASSTPAVTTAPITSTTGTTMAVTSNPTRRLGCGAGAGHWFGYGVQAGGWPGGGVLPSPGQPAPGAAGWVHGDC